MNRRGFLSTLAAVAVTPFTPERKLFAIRTHHTYSGFDPRAFMVSSYLSDNETWFLPSSALSSEAGFVAFEKALDTVK